MDMDMETLKQRQKEIDVQYVNEGLTDELLDKQIELNKLRNKYDLNLESEINDNGFVQ